jgi:PDDEXK-like domain of unknown function (DUF3799)
MVQSVKGHDEAKKIYNGNVDHEVSFFWRNTEFDFVCKGRADTLNLDLGFVADLKTTKDAEGFMKECVTFGYHIQAAFYLEGIKAMTGRDFDWYWVAVNMAAPHDTYVYKLGEEALEIGRIEVRNYMKKLKECQETDEWPNGNEGVKEGVLPSWYTARFVTSKKGEKYNEFRKT